MEKFISFLVHFLAQPFLTSNSSKTNNNIKIQRVVSLNYVPNLLEKNTVFHLPYLTFSHFSLCLVYRLCVTPLQI